MRRITKNLITLAVSAAFSTAGYAASSGNLSVIGTIKPASCTTTIGGVADASFAYGKISKTLLLQGSITPLEAKSLELKISCDGQTKLAVSALDNRPSTNPFASGTIVDLSDAGAPSNTDASTLFGLGSYGAENKHIGGYSLAVNVTSAKHDGVAGRMAYSSSSGGSWGYAATGHLMGNIWKTWASTAAAAVPVSGTEFTGDLMVKAFILPRADLVLTDNVALDGSATIEIHYL
ncbi:Protein of uncharacterised function (DUF1120) [Yersinia enterocolitica]|uniref:DUF1120 domain-containing protein n=1 Tax=Yersinia mollaretii TaxID=33060 RepID=UPI0005E5BDE2|nr:DUF1120 domain-containing protein [Yersinia mollaretii]CNK97162.1 Protein of uncharacterised function (DUF1120) [Yersinia enterocolitica]